jgi:hypothetical protein
MLSLSSLECTCKNFSKQQRENLGIERVVPRTECKEKIEYIRYDNQCKANILGMYYDLGTKILGMVRLHLY